MELLAVRTARIIAHFPTEELNPRGRAVVPEILNALAERYVFLKSPQNYDDYTDDKGIRFALGRWRDISVEEIKVHVNGLVVATGSSTDDSLALLREIIDWVVNTFGFTFREEMLNEIIYVSELVVRFERPLALLNPVLQKLASRLSETVRNFGGHRTPHDLTTIAFGSDPLQSRYGVTQFSIDRLADTPFSDNKYFAAAPLPTAEHIKFLEDFEAALKG